MPTDHSQAAFARARTLMPGGVSSPVRSWQAVGRDPVVIDHARGATVTDVDGNTYIDYVGSYGPLILGHAPPQVVEAVAEAARRGTSFGMPTELENELAARVVDRIPAAERVRFVSSGTEAVMSAIRLARAATGRETIVKCTGGYHGHSDGLLLEAGSGATTLGHPSSPGIPAAMTRPTRLLPYNDLEAARTLFDQEPGSIAAFILEPVAGNMGTIPPEPGYLEGLRALCDRDGALLIFDEVMTGFRVARGGAGERYGVRPDLVCLGKIVGGGLPCAAYAGPAATMAKLAPEGPVYQSGTLSGNPLAMAAGAATLDALEPETYRHLESAGDQLADGLRRQAARAGAQVSVVNVGSMITCFFLPEAPRDYAAATGADTAAFARFFGRMFEAGILLPPSQYETWFLSTAHDAWAIEATLEAAGPAFEAAGRPDKPGVSGS